MKISSDLEAVLRTCLWQFLEHMPIPQTTKPQEEGEQSQSEGMHGYSFGELAIRPGSTWGHSEKLLSTRPCWTSVEQEVHLQWTKGKHGGIEGNLTPSMSFLINQWSKTDRKTQHKTAVRMLRTEHSITESGTVWSSQCLKVMPGTRLHGFSSFTTITHVRLITKFCLVLVGKLAALQV